jgi:uncharacterized protein
MKMNKIFIFLILNLSFLVGSAQREFKSTGGDSTYTMKRYVFMLLDEGPNRNQDSVTVKKIQEGHMANINQMAKSGKLVVAGPFEKGGEHRGLLIFDLDTVEEALQLEGEDPAVKSGRLKMTAFYWWGARGTVIK